MKLVFIIFLSILGTASLIAQNYKLPETGIAVVSSDSIYELKVWGYHKISETGAETAKQSDYFHLGSNSKAITGFIAGRLVDAGKIKWDTKFYSLFPGWKKNANIAFYNITLAQLLSHRAGIPPFNTPAEYRKLPAFKGPKAAQRKLFAAYILSRQPAALPKDKSYLYSNAGYTIAAIMLEKVSGKTWEELVTGTLNDKLKLNAGFSWPNLADINQPYGHWVINVETQSVPRDFDYDLRLIEPAGDIKMTLPDYAKFVQLNLKGLKGTDSMLKQQTWEYLHFGIKDYAIGWTNVNQNGHDFSEHMGSAGTFTCYTLIDKQSDISYIVVTNDGSPAAQKEVINIRNQLIGKYKKQ